MTNDTDAIVIPTTLHVLTAATPEMSTKPRYGHTTEYTRTSEVEGMLEDALTDQRMDRGSDLKALMLAAKTYDAYSADMFGSVAWVEAAQMLLDYGLDERQAEGVLRSKWTRWCRDAFGEPQYYVAELYRMVAKATPAHIEELCL